LRDPGELFPAHGAEAGNPEPAARVAPLAERVRPSTPDELLGQDEIWGENAVLRRLAEQGRTGAWLFWGPPGTGKTTLAGIVGRLSGLPVVTLSAVHAGVKDLRRELEHSAERIAAGQQPTLLFVDEIHRLNKGQQDILLPALETGQIRFIGATTENPSFEVNSAILSRCLVFRFAAISPESMQAILRKAASKLGITLADDLVELMSRESAGDARRAIGILDALATAAAPSREIDLETARRLGQSIGMRYDRSGDQHFDTISAFIKSIRASHPDAALHYLARMVAAGEDPMFIARRLVIAASEDIGNANPTALLVATSAMQAVHMVGWPEARIMLAQATTYLAASPKSNRSYKAIDAAIADVESFGALDIPMHLRNAPTKLMKDSGYGAGYAYAHTDPDGARKQHYLPDALRDRRYYIPGDTAVETQLRKFLEQHAPRD